MSVRIDPGVLERVEARRMVSRSAYVERAVRAFLAHDEGSASELAGIVRRYRLAARLDWADSQRLDADAARALESFGARARS